MIRTIDLNADLGEGCSDDAGLMPLVSSCNIACGGHAGDAATMRAVLNLARTHGVAPGAHPSYPDREGFGRRQIDISAADLLSALRAQVGALRAQADAVGIGLTHLKPHGRLYNDAAGSPGLADLLAELTARDLPGCALVGPPNSALQQAALRSNIPYFAEGFIDRAYEPTGALRDRSLPGALLQSQRDCEKQAVQIATTQTVTAHSGERLPLPVSTLCIHGDFPGAVARARAVRTALEQAGLKIQSPT